MTSKKTSVDKRLANLHRRDVDGEISRREFMRRARAVGLSGLAAPAWMETLGEAARAAAQADNSKAPLDIAELTRAA